MAPTHVYNGETRVYGQLETTGYGFAPFTVTDGSTVDFGEATPPADGHWSPLTAEESTGLAAQLPDNHPDVIVAADAAAAAAGVTPDFSGLRKPQLVAACEERGLDTSGTVALLTARLNEHAATVAAAEVAPPTSVDGAAPSVTASEA